MNATYSFKIITYKVIKDSDTTLQTRTKRTVCVPAQTVFLGFSSNVKQGDTK